MAQKTLRIVSANGDEKMVSVPGTTIVREILQQFEEDDEQDRQATLLRGVTLLVPDMTLDEAGLEDGEEISLVWFDPFVEMARWRGEEMGQNLYVRIPPHITRIEDQAFLGCEALVKIVIPDSVTSIGYRAFQGCRNLTQVKIPYSVTSIAKEAFERCSSLTHVEIANSVTSTGPHALAQCGSWTDVEIPDCRQNEIGDSDDSDSGFSQLLANIPESLAIIPKYVFFQCTSLKQIKIPNSVTSIMVGAFQGCSSLTHVEIPNSVMYIGENAFADCKSLEKVDVPDWVTKTDVTDLGLARWQVAAP